MPSQNTPSFRPRNLPADNRASISERDLAHALSPHPAPRGRLSQRPANHQHPGRRSHHPVRHRFRPFRRPPPRRARHLCRKPRLQRQSHHPSQHRRGATTFLDGRGLAPTVAFTTGETRAAILQGFTIQNGAPGPGGTHGGGIVLRGASPTLRDNVFTGNLCAALDATASAPLLSGNRITATAISPACAVQAVAPVTFTGLSADGLVPTLIGNTIEANDLSGTSIQPNAGAIAFLESPAVFQNNIIRLNTTPGDAPAIQIILHTRSGTPTLFAQNLIYGNTTRCGAGALSLQLLPTATAADAALQVEILNNTIADDRPADVCSASSPTAELSLLPGYTPQQLLIANNIFAASNPHPALFCTTPLPASSLHHNLLHNSVGPILSPSCPDPGANLAADPGFVAPLTPSASLSPLAAALPPDYRLRLQSPAVDTGDNTLNPTPQVDLDGTPRLQNATALPTPIIDLGAFEHPAAAITLLDTQLAFSLTPSRAAPSQTVTLSAVVRASLSATIPTGVVTFYEITATGQNSLGTASLDATGHATMSLPPMSTGAHRITAAYPGSSPFAAVAVAPASALLLTVDTDDFSLTSSASAMSVQTTHHVTMPLTLASLGAFSGPLPLPAPACPTMPPAPSPPPPHPSPPAAPSPSPSPSIPTPCPASPFSSNLFSAPIPCSSPSSSPLACSLSP